MSSSVLVPVFHFVSSKPKSFLFSLLRSSSSRIKKLNLFFLFCALKAPLSLLLPSFSIEYLIEREGIRSEIFIGRSVGFYQEMPVVGSPASGLRTSTSCNALLGELQVSPLSVLSVGSLLAFLSKRALFFKEKERKKELIFLLVNIT